MTKIITALTALFFLFSTNAPSEAWLRRGEGGSANFKNGVLNIASMDYYTGGGMFLNWWRGAGSQGLLISSTNGTLTTQQAFQNGTYFDANGEFKIPMPADVTSYERIVFTPVIGAAYQYAGTSFNKFQGEQFNVTWDGCANPTVGIVGGNSALGPGGTSSWGSNSGSFTLGSDLTSVSNVDLRFTMTAGCYADPPRNIKVFLSRFASNVAANELTDPEWREQVSIAAYLRLMDVMQVNVNGVQEVSQLADLNYTFIGKAMRGASGNSTSSISGTTLTVAGWDSNGAPFSVGTTVIGPTISTGTVITGSATVNSGLCTPSCTGTGGNGTYAVNNSQSAPNMGSFQLIGVPPTSYIGPYGTKAGIAADVACKIANETQTGLEITIPAAASDAFVTAYATALRDCTTQDIIYSYGNENWNPSFWAYYYSFGRGGSADLNTGGYQYSGYRSAQIFDLIYTVYGQASGQGRWRGALGTQYANPGGVTAGVIAGAKAAIAADGLRPLNQIASTVTGAPYLGALFGGFTVSNVTVGATPTVTTTSAHGFSNGQLVRMRVSGGTMASVLNDVYATASSVTSTTFVININTTGLTYGGSNNTVMDSTLFKLIDQSIALNGSTPATYPTKYSYFAQQLSKVTLTGSASDASYGTITAPASYFMGGATNSVEYFFERNAVQALQNGLYFSEYEAGNGTQLTGAAQGNSREYENDFLANWQFDNGVTGDTTNTPYNVHRTHFNLLCSAYAGYTNYGAQYNDYQPQNQFGPWGALRFHGDSNPKWQAFVEYTQSGQCTDPSPAATGTLTYTPGDTYSSSANTNTDTFNATVGTAATFVIVPIFAQNTPTINSITVDGTPLSLVVANGSAVAAIYAGSVPSGSATRTVQVNWTGAPFLRRGAWLLKADNLTSTSALVTGSGSSGGGFSISVTKNVFLITMSHCTGSSTTNNYTGSTIASDLNLNDPNARGALGVWTTPLTFTTSLFSVVPTATGCNGVMATFR